MSRKFTRDNNEDGLYYLNSDWKEKTKGKKTRSFQNYQHSSFPVISCYHTVFCTQYHIQKTRSQ